jgi:chromosome segregation ATPase
LASAHADHYTALAVNKELKRESGQIIQRLHDEIADLESKLREAANDSENQERLALQLRDRDRELNEFRSRVSQLSKEKGDLEGRFSALQSSLKTDLAHVEEENKDLRAKYAKILSELVETGDDSVSKSLMMKKTKPGTPEDKIKQFGLKIEAMQVERDGMVSELKSMERANAELSSENKGLQEKLNEMKGREYLRKLRHPNEDKDA